MPIKVTCPKCQGVLHAPDDAGGKRGKCPTCGTVLAIPAAAEADGPAPQPFTDTPVRSPGLGRPGMGSSLGSEDGRRSSFGLQPDAPLDVNPRSSASRLPPSFGAPADARPPADPFTKKADRPAAESRVTPAGEARAYAMGRAGLWWAGLAYPLFLVAVVAFGGLPLLPKFGVQLPAQDPGYLQQKGLSAATEVGLAAVGGPAALGLLLLTLGRFGASRVPRSSGAKTTLVLAAMATLITACGLIAVVVPSGMAAAGGLKPGELLLADEPSGIAQRAGLAVAAVFAPLAEILFLVGLGRLAAGLHDGRFSARVTRYYFLAALIYVVVGLASYAVHYYPADAARVVKGAADQVLGPLGANRQYAPTAAILVCALSAWLVYTRLHAAARAAVRRWLDRNG